MNGTAPTGPAAAAAGPAAVQRARTEGLLDPPAYLVEVDAQYGEPLGVEPAGPQPEIGPNRLHTQAVGPEQLAAVNRS